MTLMREVKRRIGDALEITDMGEIHWLLGIEVTRDRQGRTICMSQTSYIDTVVKRFSLEEAKPILSPMEPSIRLTHM